jgi:hypothetical protein
LSASLSRSRTVRSTERRAALVRAGEASRPLLAGGHLDEVVDPADQALQLPHLRRGWLPGRRAALAGEQGDGAGIGWVGLVALSAGGGVGLDPSGVGNTDQAARVNQEGGRGLGVGSRRFQAAVEGQASGVLVGPGQQGGVAASVVAEGGLALLARRQEEAGVQGVLGDIDPDKGGSGRQAHGVPPLWLMDAGSAPGAAPG